MLRVALLRTFRCLIRIKWLGWKPRWIGGCEESICYGKVPHKSKALSVSICGELYLAGKNVFLGCLLLLATAKAQTDKTQAK